MTALPVEATTARSVPGLSRPRRAKLPAVAERVLPSGLRVVAVRRASVPVLHLRLRLPTAVRRSADLAKAALLERTMLLGTADRSQGELAEALQRIGGSLRVGGDADRLLIAGESLRAGLGDLLGLLTELVTGAAYPRAEVEREGARLAEQTRRQLSQPGVIADEAWLHRVFGEHPYGREHPSAAEVLEVSATSLRASHRRRVVPDGGLLVLVGDLSPAKALDQVATALDEWDADGGPTQVPKVPTLPRERADGLLLVDRPGAVQSNIRVGGRAPGRTDPSYAVAELTNALYGGYFSSRLVRNIREDKGYSYSPRSSLRHNAAASLVVVGAEVATEVTAPALVEIGYELGRIASVPPSAEEVADTAQYLTGTLALSTATQAGLAATLTVLLADGLDISWLREHPARLAAVTPDQVHELAQSMLAPSRLVSTVVGDAAVIKGPLAALSDLTRA